MFSDQKPRSYVGCAASGFASRGTRADSPGKIARNLEGSLAHIIDQRMSLVATGRKLGQTLRREPGSRTVPQALADSRRQSPGRTWLFLTLGPNSVAAVAQSLPGGVRGNPKELNLSEGRSAGDGRPQNGGGECNRALVGGARSNDKSARTVIGIGDELPLRVEVADRAIVDRSAVLAGLTRRWLFVRAKTGRAVSESG